MRAIRWAGLVCAILVVDSTAVSSLDNSSLEKPARAVAPAPLLLLVSGDGKTIGGVALTAQ